MIWLEQWKLFAPNFHDGMAHISIGPSVVKLYPGPGFGDTSHPTTRLVLSLMPPHVVGRAVLDIGCGCGVLSFAAAQLGARRVVGYDIDPEAVEHAKINHTLNPGPIEFHLTPPKTYQPDVVLMNMISSEQHRAWNPRLKPQLIITSGLLQTDKDDYLRWTDSLGWRLIDSLSEEGWCGCLFSLN